MRLHLAILGPRDKYYIFAKKYKIIQNKLETDDQADCWLTKKEIIPWVQQKNREGFSCWISLHDKEKDLIIGVKALCDFWIDMDSNRKDKTVKATKEELQEALEGAKKLKDYIEKEFGAYGYMAKSGNGFHTHFPLPRFEMFGEVFRKEVNNKIRELAKQVSAKAGAKGDHTYDTRRCTTLIGSLNMKIPGEPLQTRWDKDVFVEGIEKAIQHVNVARQQNKGLLEAILNTSVTKTEVVVTTVKDHPKIEELLKKDPKLNRLFKGDWKNSKSYSGKKFGSRSEAESSLVIKWIIEGCSDQEINEIMKESQIGKWNNSPQSYREKTLEKAHKFIAEEKITIKTQKKEDPSIIVDLGNDYRLRKEGVKAVLVDSEGTPIDSNNLKSVDGPRFRKILTETTGLDKKIVHMKTTEFYLLNQKAKKTKDAEKEYDKPKEKGSEKIDEQLKNLQEEELKKIADQAQKNQDAEEAEQEIQEACEKWQGKEVFHKIKKTIGYTVRRDNISKQIEILAMVTAYTKPVHLLKESPTSTGKTYNTVEISRVYPDEDVMLLGSLSPTAFAYDHGISVDKEGNDLTLKIEELELKIESFKDKIAELPRKESKRLTRQLEKTSLELINLQKDNYKLIDFENKIVVFLEDPPLATWARLRPVMSQDRWEIAYKITGTKKQNAPKKTITTILRGCPVFISFKAEQTPKEGYRRDIWEQILTRGLSLPVELSEAKYKEANKITAIRQGYPQPIVDALLHKKDFKECKKILRAVRAKLIMFKTGVREAVNEKKYSNIFFNPFNLVLAEHFPSKKPDRMREFARFMSILQGHTAINCLNRPVIMIDDVKYLVCTIHDLKKAIELYFSDEARKTIFGKIPIKQVKFFEEVIIPLGKKFPDGISSNQMRTKYKEVFRENVSSNTLNYHFLQKLENMDLITREPDPDDRRRKLTTPLQDTILVEEVQLNTLLKNGAIFSKKTLKEQLELFRKLIVKSSAHNMEKKNMCANINFIANDMFDYDDKSLSLNALYKKYFEITSLDFDQFSNNYLLETDEDLILEKLFDNSTKKEKGLISGKSGENGEETLKNKKTPENNTENETGLISGYYDPPTYPKCVACGLELPLPDYIKEEKGKKICFKCHQKEHPQTKLPQNPDDGDSVDPPFKGHMGKKKSDDMFNFPGMFFVNLFP